MKTLAPLYCAVVFASLSSITAADAGSFFSDSTLDTTLKSNYYNLGGDFSFTDSSMGFDIDVDAEMDFKDLGASAWMNWHSGWAFDVFAMEIELQGAGIAWQDGTADMTGTFMGMTVFESSASTVQYHQDDPDADFVGKLGNANGRLRYGDDANNIQLTVGRFTPTIYNLLHRPDYTYYSMHQVYEGAALTGDYQWSWGKINPWFNYFTGFSSEHSEDTINFSDDLQATSEYDDFDAIYNLGFHTESKYFTSSASYSYADDYQSNGIIEIYSGVPLSMLGFDTSADSFIKYMVKYGFEEGLGEVNDSHSTNVWEVAAGLEHGNLDFLAGITQIGDEDFIGYETQDGYTAGGGTAVWGDMALLNTYKHAGQRTLFLISGYDLNALSLPNWRVQASVLAGSDLDLDATVDSLALKEDYTEVVIDIIYGKNGYQGDGLSYRLAYGVEDHYDSQGIGFFLEYNGDIAKLFK